MMWRAISCVAAVALSLAVAGACGGIAVVDGAGGASSSASSNNSSSSNSSSGSGGAGPGSLCLEACSLINGCLAFDGCAGMCESAGTGCNNEQDAWLQCVLANTNDCNSVPACTFQLENYLQCSGVLPGGAFGCGVGGNSCDCESEGSNGPVYQSFCEQLGNESKCECSIDGGTFGFCTNLDGLSCDPWYGCCGTLFFIAGP